MSGSIVETINQLRMILGELADIDLGYPLGENTVRQAAPAATVAAQLNESGLADLQYLREFYCECDGLSMPDVHVGYFVKPLQRVVAFDPSSEPHTVVSTTQSLSVLPIGSTGGGKLFVIDRSNGSVLCLPPGPLHEGQYDGRGVDVTSVANTLPDFLEALIADVEAFIKDEQGYEYIAD